MDYDKKYRQMALKTEENQLLSFNSEQNDDITAFRQLMVQKLWENRQKPGWAGTSLDRLEEGLLGEVKEMQLAHSEFLFIPTKENLDDFMRECADVANYAMMLARNAKREKESIGGV